MENPELESIRYGLFESLATASDSLSQSEDKIVSGTPESFSSALLHPNSKENAFFSISKMSAELAKDLEKEMDKITITDDFPTDDLHLSLNLLSEFDRECEQQETLIEKRKLEIENLQKKARQFLTQEKEMEEIMKLREEKGEMMDHRPFNTKELNAMEKKSKAMFDMHREKLKQLLPQLFPKDGDKMRELLALLSKNALEGGEDYLDLETVPNLKPSAMLLVQYDILMKHPQDPRRVRFCILD